MRNIAKILIAAVGAGLLSAAAQALTEEQRQAIAERIEPAGDVCVEGEDCGSAAAAGGGGDRSGEEVYNAACNACHGTGAGGAPKVGDNGAWADRIAKGIDTLYDNAINGINEAGVMPPKGGCANCSDAEVKAAVDYMVENSQ